MLVEVTGAKLSQSPTVSDSWADPQMPAVRLYAWPRVVTEPKLSQHITSPLAMPQMPPASAVPVGSLPHDADTEPVKEQCSMAPEPGRVFMASS